MEIFIIVAAFVINGLMLLLTVLSVSDSMDKTLKRLSKKNKTSDFVMHYRNGMYSITQNGKIVLESTNQHSVINKLNEIKALERSIDHLNSK